MIRKGQKENLYIKFAKNIDGLQMLFFIVSNKSHVIMRKEGFSCCLSGKYSTCNARGTGDVGSILGLEKSTGRGNGNPFQYFCLENSMDRGAWWAAVHGVTKSCTQLSN